MLHECLRGKSNLTVTKLKIASSQTPFPLVKTSQGPSSWLMSILLVQAQTLIYSLTLLYLLHSIFSLSGNLITSNFKTLRIHPVLMAPTATILTKPRDLDSCSNLLGLPASAFATSI